MPRGTSGAATLTRILAAALAALVTLRFVPSGWCERNAQRYFQGNAELSAKAVRGAGRNLGTPLDLSRFATGNRRFDGEWRFMSYSAAAYAAAQVAAEHPVVSDDAVLVLHAAIDRALEAPARIHDTEAWGEDALRDIELEPSDANASPNASVVALKGDEHGHAAVLGYLCLALSLERLVAPIHDHVAFERRIVDTLARRLMLSKTALIESYPGETYPPDNASALACLGLAEKSYIEVIARSENALRANYIDKASGMLFQVLDGATGEAQGSARASGSAYASYFLAFHGSPLSKELFDATRKQTTEILGFGGVREYTSGNKTSRGDIDSGPLIFGMSPSATAFGMGAARSHGDFAAFKMFYGSAHIFGVPVDNTDRRNFVVGGPVCDSILAAMVTARPFGAWRDLAQRQRANAAALAPQVPQAPAVLAPAATTELGASDGGAP